MPLWDSATARQMQAKSADARRRNAATKRATEPPQEPGAVASPAATPPATGPDQFNARALARVRAQMERVLDATDALLARNDAQGQPVAPDPKALDQYASALSRLREVARQLAGEPLPGSLRPEPARKANHLGAMLGE
jgi:cell pole-organizing protein PopZ